MMRPKALGLAALLAVALLLAGCANIPTSGNVVKAGIDSGSGDALLVTLPDEPVKNASPAEILAGFIRAGRGPQLNYQVAREFLTDDFRSKWNPNAGVLVSSTPITSTSIGPDLLQVSISVSAEVDASGLYTTYPSPQTKPLQFRLAKDAHGQWRIAGAPDGTILTPNRFASIFHSYDLFFFDPSFQYLVPDARWFADSTGVATRIVKALLAGPAPWLGGGVLLSAFPNGTELTSAPTVSSGRATVDLSSQVSSESAVGKRRMTQQLTQSLNVLGTISSVSITVGGFPVTVTDGNEPDREESVLPDPVGFEKGAFGTLVNGAVRPLPGLGTVLDKLAPVGAAVGRTGDAAAILTAGGVSVVRGGVATTLDSRPGLVTPSIDPEGFVWSVPANRPGAIIAYDAQGKPHSVAFSYDGQVVSLDVSRDGTRVMIALETASGPKLLVAGVVRDKDLVPTALGQPVYPAIGTGALVDATWIDNGSVAVLAHDGATTSVNAYQLGGQSVALGTVDNAIQIVGGNGQAGLRVLDSGGSIFSPSGSFGWQDTGLNASFLASQQ
ncbi:LpqB family beta-propeller domain-containing protein [Lysinimonas soli]|uniref:LpqB family beta-propeller domain-containing protein n=1 Tax=Lysinimonas soli TaxID=1074233 RepID=A0ABW0NS37_9MICO